MWTRRQLKDRAKAALKMNYWKMVLVAFIFALLVGGGVSFNFNYSGGDFDFWGEIEDGFGHELPLAQHTPAGDAYHADGGFRPVIDISPDADPAEAWLMLMIFLWICLAMLAIIYGIGLVVITFVTNPIEVGCSRFFTNTLQKPASLKDIIFAFNTSYLNVVKVMILRTVFTGLWMMLFIIPGLVKAYEYRMIPYLMAENPNLTRQQAFAMSKQMMTGQKWNAFVLDLSFIGWEILGIFTCGLLQVFYTGPYQQATNAALFEELNRAYGYPARHVQGYHPTYEVEPQQEAHTAYQEAYAPYSEAYTTGAEDYTTPEVNEE